MFCKNFLLVFPPSLLLCYLHMPGIGEGRPITIRIGTAVGEEKQQRVRNGERPPRGSRASELKIPKRVLTLRAVELPDGEKLTKGDEKLVIEAQKAGERYGETAGFKTWREEVDATAARVTEERAKTTKAYGELPVTTENDLSREQGIDDKQVREDMAECVGNVLENPDPEIPLYDEQNLIGEKIEELLTEKDDKRRRDIMDQFLSLKGFDPNAFLEILASDFADGNKIREIKDYKNEIILIRNRVWALALRQMATKGHNLYALGRYSPKYGIIKNTFFFSPSAACADEDSGSTEIAAARIDLNDFAKYLYARREGAVDIGGTNAGALGISVPAIENYYPLDPKQLTLTQKTEMAQYWKDNAILQPAA